MSDFQYTPQELKEKVLEMRDAANTAYLLLMRCGVHPFVEFNGLMQKYVDLCGRAADKGVDFTVASTHTDVALPMVGHDVVYLAEKFECIFGPGFRANPEHWRLFKERMGLP